MPRSLIRTLAVAACLRQARLDGPGTTGDVDEVDALAAYMDERYVCPSLMKQAPSSN